MPMIRHCLPAYPRSGVPPVRRTGGAPEFAAEKGPRGSGTTSLTRAIAAIAAATAAVTGAVNRDR
jgi:hypothetical protein